MHDEGLCSVHVTPVCEKIGHLEGEQRPSLPLDAYLSGHLDHPVNRAIRPVLGNSVHATKGELWKSLMLMRGGLSYL